MPKVPAEVSGIKRRPPKRTIDKKQAIRHLLHAATRMVAAQEDPFAIHLIIQSADKLLIDVSKHRKKPLAHQWTDNVKPDYRDFFIKLVRETYNYLKHADHDAADSLHVGDIAMMNILQIGLCIVNYHTLFGEWTGHMRLMFAGVQVAFPDGFVMEDHRAVFDNHLPKIRDMKFGEFFEPSLWTEPIISSQFGDLQQEKAEDLQDNSTLYAVRIAELQAGK
jgi:hypothetical protein